MILDLIQAEKRSENGIVPVLFCDHDHRDHASEPCYTVGINIHITLIKNTEAMRFCYKTKSFSLFGISHFRINLDDTSFHLPFA